jgi:GT2 family glycosyltransferase
MTPPLYSLMSFESKNAVTVVIATLGGASLASTIAALNQGTVSPAEILICIPSTDASKITTAISDIANVKIIRTDFRGQVAQRHWGFQHAAHDIVMQLDDDIWVDAQCIERLLRTLHTLGPQIAVAPALINQATGLSVYKKPARNKLISTIYYWLMNGAAGYSPGRIDKSGSAVGVDPALSSNDIHDVEWLAGGCMMHYKKNLILENFWPLPGKAYYEDAVHSFLLKNKGIRLVIDSRAQCSLELLGQTDLKLKHLFGVLYRDYLARQYFMKRFSQPSLRVYPYYFFRIISYIYTRSKLFLKNNLWK